MNVENELGKLIFVRHAETAMAGTFCGQSDPPLNDVGLGQITELIAKLHGMSIRRVYSSELIRAKATAQAVAEEFVTAFGTYSELREIGFGDWEGLTWSEIEGRDPQFARRWIEEYPNLAAPNGEAYADFRARVLGFVDDQIATLDAGDTVVVTHAGVLQLVLTHYRSFSPEQAWEQTRSYCSHFTLERQAR